MPKMIVIILELTDHVNTINGDPSQNELPRSRAARYHRYAKSSNNFSCPRYICL
jgi:hypothetical protein